MDGSTVPVVRATEQIFEERIRQRDIDFGLGQILSERIRRSSIEAGRARLLEGQLTLCAFPKVPGERKELRGKIFEKRGTAH